MSQKKLSPDHQAEKSYSIPIGEEAEKVGPDDLGKVMVACIDRRLAEDLGVTALMFHTIYVDTDGKVYTDAVQKSNFMMPPMASAVRWSNHDEFMDTTKELNNTTAGKVLGRVKTAVYQGDIPPEKSKKEDRKFRDLKVF
jgi:hypothetical protein